MILVFILGIIAIFLIITILFVFSYIQIEINNFEISNNKNANIKTINTNENNIKNKANISYISKDYKVIISLLFLNKVRWISLHLNRLKLRKIYTKMHLERIDIKKIEQDFKLSDIKEIIKIKPNIEKLKLHIDIGLENVLLTSYIIPLICTILSIILSKNIKIQDLDEIEYIVNPIYNKGNKYNIKLSSVLRVKMVSILMTIVKIYKKSRKNQNASLVWHFKNIIVYY